MMRDVDMSQVPQLVSTVTAALKDAPSDTRMQMFNVVSGTKSDACFYATKNKRQIPSKMEAH